MNKDESETEKAKNRLWVNNGRSNKSLNVNLSMQLKFTLF